MMPTNLKQAAMRKLIGQICPEIEVKFDMSRRAKTLFGVANYFTGVIKFYRPLFAYTLDSCLHCAIHEAAHIMQEAISGYSKHDAQFQDIVKMLIEDYGTPAIAKAKKNHKLASSIYEYDR
jgi:predicted SprT family Zn-dependent metalloprotease